MTTTLPLAVAAPRVVLTPDQVLADVPCDVLAAHLLCQRALELAGKRLLNRTLRGTYTGDLRDLHTHVDVTADQLPRLLAGAFDWAEEAAVLLGVDGTDFAAALTAHIGGLLLTGAPYRIGQLPTVLRAVGIPA